VLRTWILGFGGAARVVTPASLAREICEEFGAAQERYTPTLPFDALPSLRPGPLKMWLDEQELPFAARRA
jgi:hypothetical protein